MCVAVLPAWSADSEHDLDRPGLGFDTAAAGLADLLRLVGYRYEAKQSAMARYSRIGFEAAAVSGLAVATGMAVTPVRRVAELRFGHPFAVVAVSRDAPHEQDTATAVPAPWQGMPAFSAWITDPDDVSDTD